MTASVIKLSRRTWRQALAVLIAALCNFITVFGGSEGVAALFGHDVHASEIGSMLGLKHVFVFNSPIDVEVRQARLDAIHGEDFLYHPLNLNLPIRGNDAVVNPKLRTAFIAEDGMSPRLHLSGRRITAIVNGDGGYYRLTTTERSQDNGLEVDIGSGFNLAEASGFQQSTANVNDADDGGKQSNRRYYEHPQRPKRHFRLGYEIFLGSAMLVGGLYYLSYAFRHAARFKGDTFILYVALGLGGIGVGIALLFASFQGGRAAYLENRDYGETDNNRGNDRSYSLKEAAPIAVKH